MNINTNETIPAGYYQDLDLSLSYTYNVSQFDFPFSHYGYRDFCYCHKGDVYVPIGGQIKINFTGFFTTVFYKPAFADPSPHLNIEFVGNTSFYNYSNTEAAGIFGCAFNNFVPGFLIPINNVSDVRAKALNNANAVEEYHIDGYTFIEEYVSMIKIKFVSEGGEQNVVMIYDSTSGILVYLNSKRENMPSIEISLNGYDLNYEMPIIYSFQPWIVLFLVSFISLVIIVMYYSRNKYELKNNTFWNTYE